MAGRKGAPIGNKNAAGPHDALRVFKNNPGKWGAALGAGSALGVELVAPAAITVAGLAGGPVALGVGALVGAGVGKAASFYMKRKSKR